MERQFRIGNKEQRKEEEEREQEEQEKEEEMLQIIYNTQKSSRIGHPLGSCISFFSLFYSKMHAHVYTNTCTGCQGGVYVTVAL